MFFFYSDIRHHNLLSHKISQYLLHPHSSSSKHRKTLFSATMMKLLLRSLKTSKLSRYTCWNLQRPSNWSSIKKEHFYGLCILPRILLHKKLSYTVVNPQHKVCLSCALHDNTLRFAFFMLISFMPYI